MNLKIKITQLLSFLSYPFNIKPSIHYVGQIDLHDEWVILRRADKVEDQVFNKLGKLRDDALEPKEIPGMSMNLLGGKLKIDHAKFIQKKPANTPWDFKNVNCLKYRYCIEKSKVWTPIFFHIKDRCRKHQYEIRDPNLSKNLKKLNVNTSISSTGVENLEVLTKIVHSPTMLNYWHVEFHCNYYKADENEINIARKDINKNWIYLLCKEINGHILTNSAKKSAGVYDINKKHFIKNTFNN